MSKKYCATVVAIYSDHEEETLDVSACSARMRDNTLAKLEEQIELDGGEVIKVERFTKNV